MSGAAGPFLRASWRHVAILNYEVDPSALLKLIPRGTELDSWHGKTYLSLVGFLFLGTRVMGVPIPFHRNFEEVNLRFYVRHKASDGWRRGVVFVKEMVPRTVIAFVARWLYNENYVAVPMDHEVTARFASYGWKGGGRLSVLVESDPQSLVAGSEEEFIAEHYWGYTVQRDGGTCEYHVEHPPWRVAPAIQASFEGDAVQTYGTLGRFLRARPDSAFLAQGSSVAVHRGVRVGQTATDAAAGA